MKKLLIVVDYQNDFVDGALGFKGAEKLEPLINKKIAEYRKNKNEVAFTFDTHNLDYLKSQEGLNLPVEHCIRGTLGFELYGNIKKQVRPEDKCFFKPTFGSAELMDYLKGREGVYSFIEFVGLVSNICVISNAIIAKTALPEVTIAVDSKCTASFDEKLNKAALDVMQGLQIKIL